MAHHKLASIISLALSLLSLIILCQCSKTIEKSNDISPGNTSYYIDPVHGDDAHSGLNPNQAWRSFRHINAMSLSAGDSIEITSPGSFDQTLMLKGEGTAESPVKVHFAKGRYDFHPDNVFRGTYNISNTNDSPESPKAVGILFENARHFELSGQGAKIVYRGKMIEVCIDHSENITIEDLDFDYHRPTVSEFTVLDAGDDFAVLQIHKDSTYRIENGKIIWYGEGWEFNTRLLGQQLNLETNDVKRLWNPIEHMQCEEIKPGLVRAKGKHRVKKDHIYQLRETYRDYAAVFTRRSKDVTWRNINFYFLHGMGIVCQFSENLTFDSVAIAPDATSGRTTAAWADGLHLSGCKGKVQVKDCIFKGTHDDAINIHGTYLRVVEKISDKQIKLRFMHKQTYGFMAVNPGDEIDLINHKSYQSYGLNKVIDATMLNPQEIVVTLEQSTPEDLKLEDVIENVTWTPEVEIRGCHVSWIPTRGFLLSTRKKVTVENNTFLATHASAIHMAIDANEWFESGYERDMTIRNNKFIHCAEPVIHIEPMNRRANNAVYLNIKIENNKFILRNTSIVKARSTTNLSVTGNTIVSKNNLTDKSSIDTSGCANITLENNKYLKVEKSHDEYSSAIDLLSEPLSQG
jgi:hypothetical protein